MTKINIQGDVQILQDGIVYTAKLNAIRMVDIAELKFKTNYTTLNDRYFITPENLMAMNQVFDLFPTEKWKYTFFTTAEKVNSKEPERPYLWAMVSNGVNSVYLKKQSGNSPSFMGR